MFASEIERRRFYGAIELNVLITTIHIAACLGLIIIVLLQQGKGASMGAAFGGSSNTVFGSSGAATFLSKVTTGVAVVFMLTSLTLAFFSGPSAPTSSLVTGQTGTAQEAPVTPGSGQTTDGQSSESQPAE